MIPEAKRAEPRYRITITATAANIVQMRKRIQALDPSSSVAARIDKIERSPSRADRLSDAMSDAQDVLSEVESLHEEIESWRENLPEGLSDGDKAGELDECLQALDEVKEALDQAIEAGSNVSFPGMY